MRTTSIIFLFALLLQGCGHKGPLYLPAQQPAATGSPTGSQPAGQQPAQPQPQAQPAGGN